MLQVSRARMPAVLPARRRARAAQAKDVLIRSLAARTTDAASGVSGAIAASVAHTATALSISTALHTAAALRAMRARMTGRLDSEG